MEREIKGEEKVFESDKRKRLTKRKSSDGKGKEKRAKG
jgi:hypothetical protein